MEETRQSVAVKSSVQHKIEQISDNELVECEGKIEVMTQKKVGRKLIAVDQQVEEKAAENKLRTIDANYKEAGPDIEAEAIQAVNKSVTEQYISPIAEKL